MSELTPPVEEPIVFSSKLPGDAMAALEPEEPPAAEASQRGLENPSV